MPVIISDVTTSTTTTSEATITWTTDKPAVSIIDYGLTSDLGSLAGTISTYTESHSVALTNLAEDTEYFYRVRGITDQGIATESDILSFTTASTPLTLSAISTAFISNDAAVITWESNKPATSRLQWGQTTELGQETAETSSRSTSHAIILNNLSTSTSYFYTVRSVDDSGNEIVDDNSGEFYSFTTIAPEVITVTTPGPRRRVTVERIPDGYKTEEEWCAEKNYFWYDDSCHTSPESIADDDSDLTEELLEEDSNLFDMVRTASETVVLTILDALELNQNIDQVQEEQFVESISEISRRVISSPTISGPDVNVAVSPRSALISWTTDKNANSLIAYSPASLFNDNDENPYQLVVGDPNAMTTNHAISIIGLEPDTTYHFQIRSNAKFGPTATTEDMTFTTLPLTADIVDVRFETIEESVATLTWETTLPTRTAINIRNGVTGETGTLRSESFLRDHTFAISDLTPGTPYTLQVVSEDENGILTMSSLLPFTTALSINPPTINQVRTTTTIVPGSPERVQTIISWRTDKPATSRVLYQAGVVNNEEPTQSTPASAIMTTEHIVITSALQPGLIYTFRVESVDAANNRTVSRAYTLATPQPREDIIDLIFRNFQQTFSFLQR